MKAKRFFRVVSSMVLVTFGSLTMQPLQAAIQVQRAQAKAAPAPKAADEQYGETLREIEEQSLKAKANRRHGKPSKAEARAIRSLVKDLNALEGGVEAGFAATEKHLRDKKLAQVILDRHNEAVTTFRQKRDEFMALMREVDGADDNGSDLEIDAALTLLSDFFEKHSQIRKRAKLGPNKLPWRTPEVTKRVPITDPNGFKTARFGYEPTPVAGAVPKGTALPKALSAMPTPEDLAETEDAQITPAIRAKAQELGNDPLTIYNWVRNNIRFIPTYGSIQGSQDTLDKLAGNAFDTASLLIALLRAANVPARYAYGTIEVPVNKFMNWVGGVTKVEAAQQLLGQGGIPNAPVVSGGVVSHIQMEHVWVEAWIDYLPSRGAQHVEGDTWVPVDASFKQYTFTSPIALDENLPLDVQAIEAGARQGAAISEADGWIQGLNREAVNTQITAYAARIQAYITNNPQLKIGDLVGDRAIAESSARIFAGVSNYKVAAKGDVFSALPPQLKHKFRYAVYASIADRIMGSPLLEFEGATSNISNKSLTLIFRPATEADYEFIRSLLPASVDSSQLPTTVPAYASLIPEFRVNGHPVATGAAVRLGAHLFGSGGFTNYDLVDWDLSNDDTLVAGQSSAIGLSVQGLSERQLKVLGDRVNLTASRLEGGQLAEISTSNLIDDILIGKIWGYFANLHGSDDVASSRAGVIDRPAMSYGLLHTTAQPNKIFGVITTSVTYAGFLFDVGHVRRIRAAMHGEAGLVAAYAMERGQYASGIEHDILEQFLAADPFCNVELTLGSLLPPCGQGISAIRVLGSAAAAGQKMYGIRAQNVHVLGTLNHSIDVIDEVKDAVTAGLIATIHQSRMNIGSWSGSGYVLFDPSTGSGAYLIEGGARGGSFYSDVANLLSATLGLFVPSAHAADGTTDSSKLVAFLEAVGKVMEHLGRGFFHIFGHYGTLLKELADWISILKACAGQPGPLIGSTAGLAGMIAAQYFALAALAAGTGIGAILGFIIVLVASLEIIHWYVQLVRSKCKENNKQGAVLGACTPSLAGIAYAS